MRARVYASGLGRFLSPDPIGFASGQLNLYAYVGNDPINGIDPSGLMEEDDDSDGNDGGVIEVIEVTGKRPDGPTERERLLFAIALSDYILDDLLLSLSVLGLSPSQIAAICNSDPKDPEKAIFPTKAEAAANAFKFFARRFGTDKEIGAVIVRVRGGFKAVNVTVGSPGSVSVNLGGSLPSNLVAIAHNHPSIGDRRVDAVNEMLSSPESARKLFLLHGIPVNLDGPFDTTSFNSLYEGGFTNLTAFLLTPSGRFVRFDAPFTPFDKGKEILPKGCLAGKS